MRSGYLARHWRLSALALVVLVAALLGGWWLAGDGAGAEPLQGGVLATFDVAGGEQFRVWVTNAETIRLLNELQAGRLTGAFPNGPILRGPGQGDHNAPWSWHLDPERLTLVQLAIEACDGRPSDVEEHVDEFVETIGRYCPWGATLVALEDYR